MEIAKLTSKGQLTMPISIRKRLGLNCGDKVAFVEKDGEYILVNASRLTLQPQKCNNADIENVIATMNLEGLKVSQETIDYLLERAKGNITVEQRVQQLKSKYTER